MGARGEMQRHGRRPWDWEEPPGPIRSMTCKGLVKGQLRELQKRAVRKRRGADSRQHRAEDMTEENMVRVAIICVVLLTMLLLAGCVGAYRLERPLGPTKGDRFPVCDHAAIPKTCERT